MTSLTLTKGKSEEEQDIYICIIVTSGRDLLVYWETVDYRETFLVSPCSLTPQLPNHLLVHDDLHRLLLMLLHHYLFQQSDGRSVVYALVASECVARVESFLALVTVEGARVAVDGRHVVSLDGLRLERGAADLTEVGTDRGVACLMLAQVCLKHVVKVKFSGFANRFYLFYHFLKHHLEFFFLEIIAGPKPG